MDTYCRSPQEIVDDTILHVHTAVTHQLNMIVAGRCLYVGQQRIRLQAVLDMAEAMILGTRPADAHHLLIAHERATR